MTDLSPAAKACAVMRIIARKLREQGFVEAADWLEKQAQP